MAQISAVPTVPAVERANAQAAIQNENSGSQNAQVQKAEKAAGTGAVGAVPVTASSKAAPASLSRGEAREATKSAVAAAKSVTSSLKAARAALSSGTLYVGLDRLMRDIERTVQSAAYRGVNLVSSGSDRISIRNGAYGGRIPVATQPLDAEGLGLTDLLAVAKAGPAGPQFLVQAALDVATERMSHLENLHQALSSVNPEAETADPMTDMMQAGIAAVESRGIAVDLVG